MLCKLGQQQQKETKENKKTKMAKASEVTFFHFLKTGLRIFFGPKALSFFPPVVVPECLEVTFV